MPAFRINRSITYVIEDLNEECEYKVSFEPSRHLDTVIHPVIRRLPDGRTALGYLSDDSNCNNPLEDTDGSGRIYRRYRDAGNEEKRQFYQVMGIDEDGHRTGSRDPYSVLLDCYQHSGECWRVHGSDKFFPDEQCDVSNQAGVWAPDDACRVHIEMTAAEKVLNCKMCQDYMGNKRAADIPAYTYSLQLPGKPCHSGYRTTMTAIKAACRRLGKDWKSVREPFNLAAREVAVECAGQAVETYNHWLAGEVFGVIVVTYKANGEPEDDEDACWGYVGLNWAMQVLTEAMAEHYGNTQET